MAGDEPLLSVRKAARIVGVHEHTLRKWLAAGVVQFLRVGPHGLIRVRPSDLLSPGEPPPDPKPTRHQPTKAPDAAIEAKLIEMRGASRRR